MKPVTQTKFGGKEGNCFAACLASLLEISLDEVIVNTANDEWLDSVQAFLKPRNLFFVEVRIDVAVAYPLYELRDYWVIFTGKAKRGLNHSVIGKLDMTTEGNADFIFIHDPHPDRTFLSEKPFGIGFLAVLDAAKI